MFGQACRLCVFLHAQLDRLIQQFHFFAYIYIDMFWVIIQHFTESEQKVLLYTLKFISSHIINKDR